ncbi:MAG: STAS domain-containing protein [Synechocystis sp.]
MPFSHHSPEQDVFYARGTLSAATIKTFRQDLNAWLTATTAPGLVIDFSSVDFLDSSTLVVLVDSYKQARRAGKQLMLSGVSPELKIIFELTQLDSVFTIYPTPDAAFDSLNTLPIAA